MVFSFSRYKTILTLIILGALVLAGIFWWFLPAAVPMQWATDGSVNYRLSKNLAVWLLPVLPLIIGLQGWSKAAYKYLVYAGIAVLGISGIFLYILISA